MLGYFSFYLKQQLHTLSTNSKQPQSDSPTNEPPQPEPLHILVAILQSLLTIIERVKYLPYELISASNYDTDSKKIGNQTTQDWKSVFKFVNFSGTSSTPHPLVDIRENLQKYFSQLDDARASKEINIQLKMCSTSIHNIIERLTTGKESSGASKGNPSFAPLLLWEPVQSEVPQDQNLHATCGILEDSDFMDDLFTPTAEVIQELQSTTPASSYSGSSAPSDGEPVSKKLKTDMRMATPKFRSRELPFRQRKSNTSRPPSMHVDTFEKKTLDTSKPNSNNIKDMLFMEAKAREMRQEYPSKPHLAPKRKEMTASSYRPTSNIKRRDDPPPSDHTTPTSSSYFGRRGAWDSKSVDDRETKERYDRDRDRDSLDRYDRDKYRTSFSSFQSSSSLGRSTTSQDPYSRPVASFTHRSPLPATPHSYSSSFYSSNAKKPAKNYNDNLYRKSRDNKRDYSRSYM